MYIAYGQTCRTVLYTLVAFIVSTGSCKPTPPGGQEKTPGGSAPATKPMTTTNSHRLTRSTPALHENPSDIPASTEHTSAEMTTLSADDVGVNDLEQFKMQMDNLGMAAYNLFNRLRSSEETTRYLASLSNYPSISNNVRENVKNCTHLQATYGSIFDLIYSYARRYTTVLDYIYQRYTGQWSLVHKARAIDQLLWSLMIDLSVFVIPTPVTEAPPPPVEYIAMMETLATLHVQCEAVARIFQDLKRCSSI